MGYIVLIASQKGGVGKSTLARMMAREAAINGLGAKIADLDTQQSTSAGWSERRLQNGIEPTIRVERFGDAQAALREAKQFDVYILDGAPHASQQTLEVAKHCDLVILPTSESFEDREPAVKLANDLYQEGMLAEKIVFALCLVGDSDPQLLKARAYLGRTMYQVLPGELPERSIFKTLLQDGKAPTEIGRQKLRERTERLAQSAIDALVKASQVQEVAVG